MTNIYQDKVELMPSYLKLGPGNRFTPLYDKIPSKSEKDNPNYKIIPKDDKTLLGIIKDCEEYSKIFNKKHMENVAYFIECNLKEITYEDSKSVIPAEHFYQEILKSTAKKIKNSL